MIEPPYRTRSYTVLLGIVACYLAIFLTGMRTGVAGLLLRIGTVTIAVDLLLTLTPMRTGLTEYGGDLRWWTSACLIGGFIGALLFVRTAIFAARRGASAARVVDALAVFGCLMAPLLPTCWIMQDLHKSTGGILMTILSYITLSDRDLGVHLVLEAQSYDGLHTHWLSFCGSILCSLFAAWLLMEAWRQVRIMPSR